MRPVGDLAAVPASIRAAGDVPARIPGCVHTDLMRAGLIPDPRIGTNELDLLWIGDTDWEYRCTFEITPEQLAHERLDLACDGLDTIAELSLNGQPIGTASNMFHPHRFDLRTAAKLGANELSILFRSPMKHIRAEQSRLGALPHNGDGLGWSAYNFIRKPACNFGWDWALNVATSGISEAMRIEAWNRVRLRAIRTLTHRYKDEWTLDIDCDFEWSEANSGGMAALIADVHGLPTRVLGGVEVWGNAPDAPLTLGPFRPKVWCPRGNGSQHLYELEIHVVDGARASAVADFASVPVRRGHGVSMPVVRQTILESHRRTIAFRELRLNSEPLEQGSKFELEVNGTPIFCKGANWISEGLFPDDRSDEVIRERVRQAAAANMNMLRVWGGGMYESDAFYDECDKLGIMVWQDFMFACACYPEEAPFRDLIQREANHQIARLSSHPSVVLWCGGNECVWGRECWGHAKTDAAGPWKERTKDRAWGSGYWFDLLPRLLRDLDPTRPYWPNSPFGGALAEHPNQHTRGNRHMWDARPGTAAFRAALPRFCTEFGVQSAPSIETLNRFVPPDELVPDSHAMHHRQRGTGGMFAHIEDALAEWLKQRGDDPTLQPREGESALAHWIRLTQTMQADALRDAIEHLASDREGGRCMGALIWQFNDAWPGMSWSLIDSDGRPKPAYFAVRDAFAKIV